MLSSKETAGPALCSGYRQEPLSVYPVPHSSFPELVVSGHAALKSEGSVSLQPPPWFLFPVLFCF